jgi:hypothetical protein
MRGYASTSRTARVLGLGRKEIVAMVVMWWHVWVYVTCGPTPHIYIEHTNELPCCRLISTLIQPGSNILQALI